MGKKGTRALSALLICLILSGNCFAASEQKLTPVGQAVGLQLQAMGLVVAGFSEQNPCPAKNAGVQIGDLLLEANGNELEDSRQLSDIVGQGKPVQLLIEREGTKKEVTVKPEPQDGIYRLGLYVRGSISGIGTITYYNAQTGEFGALGHGVNDAQTHRLLPLQTGSVIPAEVCGVQRGSVGTPGSLQGEFDAEHPLGVITRNTSCGIFGKLSQAPEAEAISVASADEVHLGAASIRCNVQGKQVQDYAVEICGLDPEESTSGRNLMLEVKDPALLECTGGIVQGMSGSPILQDGKLVGAVTHVLVNDPTKGYGILIENMLDAAA